MLPGRGDSFDWKAQLKPDGLGRSNVKQPIMSTGRRRTVMVGGGLAALRATEELRKKGYDGEIAIVTSGSRLPYDKPPLSKDLLLGKTTPGEIVYRDEAFYRDQEVDVYLDHHATDLRIHERVLIANGAAIHFDDLVVCTGASPRPLPLNTQLGGIHTVGSIEDTLEVSELLKQGSPRVVIMGAGFIGAEVASGARALGLDTTIVNLADTPLERAVGQEMGRHLSALHADYGVKLHCGMTISELYGTDRVEQILLSNGQRIPCDVLVVGIGSTPNIEWLRGSALELGNGIVCDASLCAGVPGIYAAGDVAYWPNGLFDRWMRCEQWTNAADQGRHVARNILAGHDARMPFEGSNYFWSDQYGHRIQFAGSEAADEIAIVKGSIESRRFVAYYRKGHLLCGALAVDSARELMQAKMQIEKRTSWADALDAMNARSDSQVSGCVDKV